MAWGRVGKAPKEAVPGPQRRAGGATAGGVTKPESTATVGVCGVWRGQEEAGQSEEMLPHCRHHQGSRTLLTVLGSADGAELGNRELCPMGA